MIVYQVQSYSAKVDQEFPVEADAIAAAEKVAKEIDGQVSLITWNVSPNLPRCQPAMVYRSCALRTFSPAAGWRKHNIHG